MPITNRNFLMASEIYMSIDSISHFESDIEDIVDANIISNRVSAGIREALRYTRQRIMTPYSRKWIKVVLSSIGTIHEEHGQSILREGWKDDLLQLAKVIRFIPSQRFNVNVYGRSMLYKSIFLYVTELTEIAENNGNS